METESGGEVACLISYTYWVEVIHGFTMRALPRLRNAGAVIAGAAVAVEAAQAALEQERHCAGRASRARGVE